MRVNDKKFKAVKQGRFLYLLINILGIKQCELAKSYGISASMVSRHFKGERELPTRIARQIERDLGIPMSFIYEPENQ